ncbi:MAG: radical SAM protein, partial [Thermoplasmata archaeon]|nr:radical SAM protein [Thermoplasmata archaeon]
MDTPGYVHLFRTGELGERVSRALSVLEKCNLCPRNCGVDRLQDERGFCRTGRRAVVSSVHPHFGEESVLVGYGGSGTIFFTHCNLRCLFCQNYDISQLGHGREVGASELAGMMLGLQEMGCHNINLVTPSHVVPQILEALEEAAMRGLEIPVVYNTGGYDSVETLRLLDGVVDIYLPDAKYWESGTAAMLSDAPDYPEVMMEALGEMHRQVGDLQTRRVGALRIAERGVLVRHL